MFNIFSIFFGKGRSWQKLSLKNKKVVVMGIGLHGGGVSMIKWLVQQGARVVATDKKSRDVLAPSLNKLKKIIKNKKVELVIGRHRLDDFRSADMIVKNPMIPWSNVYIKVAKKKHIDVEMDSSLFFQLCPSKKIIGITGTKGKTTTAHIVKEILEKAGKKTVLVGVGQIAVMDKLKSIKKNTYVIFELSSWRLSALRYKKISPRYAIVTNIYPDHLNYYKKMSSYIKDKMTIVKYQKKNSIAVLNYDDKEVRNFADETRAKVSFYSFKDSYSIIHDVYVDEGQIKYRLGADEGVICSLDELKLKGEHNVYNFMAAITLTLQLGISLKNIKKAIIGFKGIPHRLEFVGTAKGVYLYNDSAATTPEASVAGIDTFIQKDSLVNIYLIAGGSSKKLNMNSLADKIVEAEQIKKVVILKGLAGEELVKLIKKKGGEKKIVGMSGEMMEAVKFLAQEIKSAEERRENNSSEFNDEDQGKNILLLSPGSASFGVFKNEFDRGKQFKDSVKKVFGVKLKK